MTNNIDPWELLREARESVEQDFDWGEHDAAGRQTLLNLLKRIDAALAEHTNSATPVVESEVEWNIVRDTWAAAYPVDDVELSVIQQTDGSWRWWTTRKDNATGTTSTVDEAKAAAIRAARGLK